MKPAYWDDATRALGRAIRVMRRLIRGIAGVHLTRRGDAFTTLSRAIVGQQISVKAAQTIWSRYAEACGAGPDSGALGLRLDPARVARMRLPKLRSLRSLGAQGRLSARPRTPFHDRGARPVGVADARRRGAHRAAHRRHAASVAGPPRCFSSFMKCAPMCFRSTTSESRMPSRATTTTTSGSRSAEMREIAVAVAAVAQRRVVVSVALARSDSRRVLAPTARGATRYRDACGA